MKRKTVAVKTCIRLADLPSELETQIIWALPATAEAYDAMVEQMARAICKQLKEPARVRWTKWGEESRAALAAIGITRSTQ